MIFVFDIAKFRVDFPAFADPVAFPDATLTAYWDTAGCYISTEDYGNLNGNCRLKALYLMTAHLTALSVIIARGQVPGLKQSASIDKISVTLTPPPVVTQFQWWLSLTPYGQQLLALLQSNILGGFYVGGSPERMGFRKIGGGF